jgi:hypothetical protein
VVVLIVARRGSRAEIEGRAVVDAASGCGWCGSTSGMATGRHPEPPPPAPARAEEHPRVVVEPGAGPARVLADRFRPHGDDRMVVTVSERWPVAYA